MTTHAGILLRHAAEIVDGDRNQQHGNKERSFGCIAEFWTRYLSHRNQMVIEVSAADVAAMMVLLKLARYLYGEPIEDHFVDMAGYSAILAELETPDETPSSCPDRRVGPDRTG